MTLATRIINLPRRMFARLCLTLMRLGARGLVWLVEEDRQ